MGKIDYTGITTRQHNAINDVMDAFEFDKVEAHMQAVNWQWSTPTKDDEWHMEVPDLDRIKRSLRKMLVRVYNTMNENKRLNPDFDSPCYSSCGGFTVYVWPDDTCQAYFSVAEWWIDSEILDNMEDDDD